MKTSSFNEASVKIEISLETISSADQKRNIFKEKTSSASSVENENEKVKAISKIERIINIKKKVKLISRQFRSRNCLEVSDMIFVDVVVYNLLSKQKNVKLFVIFFKDIDDQIQKNTKISIDFKIILSKKFHDLLNVFFKTTSDELTSHREHDHKIILKKNQKLEHSSLKNMNFRKLNFVKQYFENYLKKEFIIANHASCFSSILLAKKLSD